MTRLFDWRRFWALCKAALIAVLCMALVIGLLVHRARKNIERQVAAARQGEIAR